MKPDQYQTAKSAAGGPVLSSRWFAKFFAVFSLCMIILVHNLLPGEMLPPLVVMLAMTVLLIAGKVNLEFLRLVWPLLMILFLGLIGIKEYETRDILRDIAYALTPIALLYIGYWMAGMKEMWPLILKVMVVCGVVLAFNHIAKFIHNPALLQADLGALRKEAGFGSGLVVLSLVLCFFQHRFGNVKLFPRVLPRLLAMPVLLTSLILSFSRTGFVQAVIMSLALSGVIGRFKLRSILAVGLVIIGFAIIIATSPKDDQQSFSGKLSRSITEVAVDDYTEAKDINANWRGFETYRVIDSFLASNILHMSIGQGAGALVDLGFTMKLGDGDYRYIPIFHNGYAYVLIKTGLLGLVCYLYFFLRTIIFAMRSSTAPVRQRVSFSRMLLGCVLCIMASMYVVGGMAEIHDAELVLLLGYLSRRLARMESVPATPAVLVRKKEMTASSAVSEASAG